MIITCPSCKKRFEINETLIPVDGRNLQCGSCGHVWFFKKIIENEVTNPKPTPKKINKTIKPKNPLKEKNQIFNDSDKKTIDNKGSEIVKYQSESVFTFARFLSYILVLIISFIGLILILDTFKTPLYKLFPNLEFFLFSLYETLKDIELFVRDLI